MMVVNKVSQAVLSTGVETKLVESGLPTSAATNGKIAVAIAPESEYEPCERYKVPEGLTRTQKRNFKKNVREKERKALGKTGGRGNGQSPFPEDPLHEERAAVLEEVEQALAALPVLTEMTALDALASHGKQQTILDQLTSRLIDANEQLYAKVPRPDNRRLTPAVLVERIKELASLPERDELALDNMEKQLHIAVCWENARKFQTQVAELKKKVEDRQRANGKYLQSARNWEQLKRWADRIISLKSQREESTVNITPRLLKRVQVDVSSEAQSLLASSNHFTHRVERLFGVVVERLPDRSRPRSFNVCGLPDDVQSVTTFLTQADWSGSMTINVNARVMPLLIGKGGRGIRQLEDTFQCLLQVKPNNDIIVYGLKVNGEKTLDHIRAFKPEKTPETFVSCEVPLSHSAVGRALMTKFARYLRNLETEHGVTVRCVVPARPIRTAAQETADVLPFGGDCTGAKVPEPLSSEREQFEATDSQKASPYRGGKESDGSQRSFVTIRGRTSESLENARQALLGLISCWEVVCVPVATPEALHALFSRSLGGYRGGALHNETGSYATSPSEQFKVLVDVTENVAFIKSGTEGVALVGRMEDIQAVQPQVVQLCEKAAYRPLRLVVPQHVAAVCCSPPDVRGLEEKTNVSIRRVRAASSGTVTFIILGSPTAAEAAKAEIQQWIEARGNTLSVPMHSSKLCDRLNHRATLRGLEQKYGCRIIVDRNERVCTVVGPEDGIQKTQEALQAMEGEELSPVTEAALPKSGTEGLERHGSNARQKQAPEGRSAGMTERTPAGIEWGASVTGDVKSVLPKVSSTNGRSQQWGNLSSLGGVMDNEALDHSFPTLGEVAESHRPSKHGRRRRRGVGTGNCSGSDTGGPVGGDGIVTASSDADGPVASTPTETSVSQVCEL